MRKGQSDIGGLSRPTAITRLLGLVLAIASISVFALVGAGAARAEGADDWSQAVFAKSTKAASLGTDFGGTVATRKGRKSSSSKSTSTKLASLGNDGPANRQSAPVTGGGVRWVASSGCLNGTLISAINSIAASFGAVTVSSTCRSSGRNRAVGGAPKSHHLSGNAADFRVHGNWGAAFASLRSNGSLGGIKHYGGGLFHIDTGPRRSW